VRERKKIQNGRRRKKPCSEIINDAMDEQGSRIYAAAASAPGFTRNVKITLAFERREKSRLSINARIFRDLCVYCSCLSALPVVITFTEKKGGDSAFAIWIFRLQASGASATVSSQRTFGIYFCG